MGVPSNLSRFVVLLSAFHFLAQAIPSNHSFPLIRPPTTPRPNANQSDLKSRAGVGTWGLQTEYAGETFFNGWTIFDAPDPSHGLANYVGHDEAFAKGLAFFTADQVAGIQADHWSTLPVGALRDSIRIQSKAVFTGGLFIIALELMPWGCGVWPSFWTLGYGAEWPIYGEIDIIEGIQAMTSKHTMGGCMLDTAEGLYTGTTTRTNCDSSTGSPGCGVISPSDTSYGEQFHADGGGVFAMLWDDSAIQFWDWSRLAVPNDITVGTPSPSSWGLPAAAFSSSTCDIGQLFKNNQLVITVNLCGDWAGDLYDGQSYQFIFLINYVKVFQLQATSNVIIQPPAASATIISGMSTGRGGAVGNNVTYSPDVAGSGSRNARNAVWSLIRVAVMGGWAMCLLQ